MKLKILHIAKFYYPYSGGMETIIKDIAEGVADKGHHVRVICSNSDNTYSEEIINDVEVIRYPLWAKLSSQTINPGLLFSIRKHGKWADVVQVHSPNPVCEMMSLFISKRDGTKVISTHHSDIYRQKYLKRFYRPIWNLFIRKLDKIIIPTKNHLEYSDMIDHASAKTHILPFGIKDDNYLATKNSQEIKDQYGKYLLFVGRLVEYKGVSYLIDAIKNIDVNLVIIGGGPLKEKLKAQINNNDSLKKKVFLLGRVESQEEVNAFYENAYSFVLPSVSKNENFGIVQLEAMIHGLPIICTNLESGVPCVGIPGKTTLLSTPCDSKSLEESIYELMTNELLAKRLGKAGKELFYSKYTYEQMAHEHTALYHNLLGIEASVIKTSVASSESKNKALPAGKLPRVS